MAIPARMATIPAGTEHRRLTERLRSSRYIVDAGIPSRGASGRIEREIRALPNSGVDVGNSSQHTNERYATIH